MSNHPNSSDATLESEVESTPVGGNQQSQATQGPGNQQPPPEPVTLAGLQAEIAALRAQVAELRAGFASQASVLPATTATPPEAPPTPLTAATRSRRAVLLGGIGASIAGVGALAGAGSSAAATGNMQFGATNNAGPSETVLSGQGARALTVQTTGANGVAIRGLGNGAGVWGYAAKGFAVRGQTDSGIGVFAESKSNYALMAYSENGAPLALASGRAGVPTTGTWGRGALLMTTTGELWVCIQGGIPGTWRMLAGPDSAGAYTPIPPIRAYDSRFPMTPDASGPMASGTSREINIRSSRNAANGTVTTVNVIPENSSALTINLTVTQTQGAGHLSLAAGGTANKPSTSAINWQSTGQTIANGLTVPASANGRVKVWCQGGTTNVFIDITGYFRSA
jgi:hypothetical protein